MAQNLPTSRMPSFSFLFVRSHQTGKRPTMGKCWIFHEVLFLDSVKWHKYREVDLVGKRDGTTLDSKTSV
jgi:hypothetical protein